MPSFAHLCPECLDVPTAQCGYRACPQRALQTAAVTSLRPRVGEAWQAAPPQDPSAQTIAYSAPAPSAAVAAADAATQTALPPVRPRRPLEDQP